MEVRAICNALIDDPQYRFALRKRMIDGNAGSIEVLIWHYAKGKPIDRVETSSRGGLSSCTDEDLRARLVEALKSLRVHRSE